MLGKAPNPQEIEWQKHKQKAAAARTVNLSDRQLTNAEINLLEKGLTFIPTPKLLPVENIIKNKNTLIRNIKLRGYFSNKSTKFMKKKFTNKSIWVPDSSKLNRDTINCVDKIENCTQRFLSEQNIIHKSTNNTNRLVTLINKTNIDNRALSGTNSNHVRAQTNTGKAQYNYENMQIKNMDKSNITAAEVECIQALSKDKSITIRPFDKGGGITVLSRVKYIQEANRQLYNDKYYKKLPKLLTADTAAQIKQVLNNMFMEGFINKKQFMYLSGPDRLRPRTFYLLPKVHKPVNKWPNKNMPEGRPVVSDIDSESYRVSEYIEHHIKPLANKHNSYIKNSHEFVKLIKNKNTNKNSFIVTGDVSALYTNMHIDRSLKSVETALRKNPDKSRPDKYILELLEITMRNSDFEFNNEYFLQILGIAMGKRYAPQLANLYLIDFDTQAMEGFKIKPSYYVRYLDDIFFLWEGTEIELKEYEQFLNSRIPDIKVTLEYSQQENNFLDTTIYKQQTQDTYTLQSKVYFKDTDTHQLLHTESYHPKHTFKGLVRSQYIRFKRLSSTREDYIHTCKILHLYLKNRGYTYTTLKTQMWDIWHNYKDKQDLAAANTPESTVEDTGENTVNNTIDNTEQQQEILPIITEFWPGGREISKKYRDIINNTKMFENTKLITAYKANPNLKSQLVRSKLPPLYDGQFQSCGSIRCGTCSHAMTGDSFSSTTNNKIYHYLQNNNCASKNIIYLITCAKCRQQYVGETQRELRQRVTDHRHCIRNKVKTPVGLHFNRPDHTLEDLRVTVLESLYGWGDNVELRREKERQWQVKLGTIFPRGINDSPCN